MFAQVRDFPTIEEDDEFDDGEFNPFSEGVDSIENENEDTTDQIIFQNTDTINFVNVVREFDLNLERFAPEFSLDNVHLYQPYMKTEEPSRNYGNNGLPIFPLTYHAKYYKDVNIGLNNYDSYLIQDEDVKYYRAQRPFTKMFYATGSERENRFMLTHTQNWGRGLNVGFDYHRLVSNGFYTNQEIDHNNFAGHAWFQSKNKKLNVMSHYISNKFLVGTNGGIQSGAENYYLNEDFSRRRSIPVKMEEAEKLFKGNSLNVQSSFDLGESIDVEINDSISDTQLVPRFRFQHTFNYSKSFDNFRSSLLEEDYFENTYIDDTLTTSDSLDVKILSNEFRMKWLGNRLNDSSELERQNFLADIFANFSNYQLEMPVGDYEDDFVDLRLGGSFRSNPLDSPKIIYKAEGEFHAIGYRLGDYYARGEAGFNFDNIAGRLIGYLELLNQEQDYTANHFFQSHYQFNNDFNKLNARTLGGEYFNPLLDATFRVRFVNATNILYYDETRTPQINGSAVSYILANASKHFQLGRFHSNLSGYYQTTSDAETIRKPTYLASGDLFFKGPLFKNKVVAKIGVNGRWASDDEYDNYDPSLDQFFVQTDFQYNNNPQIGFFSNFQLSRARVFLRLDHLTSFLYENPIMQGHLYPQHDFAFRAGINWVFVN